MLSLPFLRKFQIFNNAVIFNQLEEIFLIFLIPLSYRGLKWFIKKTKISYLFIACFCFYLIIGVVSGFFSPTSIQAIILQLLLELKLPIVFFVFCGAISLPSFKIENFIVVFKLYLILSVPLVLLQFVNEVFYKSIFTGASLEGVLNTGSFLLPRGIGFFWHPSELAFFSAVMYGLFLNKLLLRDRNKNFLWLLLCLFLLFSSVQRHEIFSVLLLCSLFWVFLYRSKVWGRKIIVAQIVMLILMTFIPLLVNSMKSSIMYSIEQEGLLDIGNTNATRAVYYFVGIQVANKDFPLGGGLGSFGGKAAVLFDSYIHHEFNFDNFWWYREKTYMTDTFWPHVLGEAGWLGGGALLISYLSLIMIFVDIAKKSSGRDTKLLCLSTIFGMLFFLNISLTSPVPTSMFCLILTFVFIGCLPKQNLNCNAVL